MNPLGWRLRHARRTKGIELNALARKIGVSTSILSYWETGGRNPRGMDSLRKLVKELGVRWAWLMDGEQPMFEDGTLGPPMPKFVSGQLSLAQTVAQHPRRWSLEVIEMVEDLSESEKIEDWKSALDAAHNQWESRNAPPPSRPQGEVTSERLHAERERKLRELGAPPEVLASVKRGRGRPRKIISTVEKTG